MRMPEQSLDVRARSVELVSLTPFFERFRARLDGLGDDEYLWEPTPGCVTVQPGAVGPFVTGGPQRRGPDQSRSNPGYYHLVHLRDRLLPYFVHFPVRGRGVHFLSVYSPIDTLCQTCVKRLLVADGHETGASAS